MAKQNEPEQLLRLTDVIGSRKKGIPPLISVSRSTWLRRVGDGTFPKPIKIGVMTMWKASDVQRLISRMVAKAGK